MIVILAIEHHVMMVCPKFLEELTASVFMASESSIWENDPGKSVSEGEFAWCSPDRG